MEEINIKEFLGYLKNYILYIIVGVLLLLVLAYSYESVFKKPKYTTYTTLVLVKDNSSNYVINNDAETITQNDILLNQKLVSTYRQIINSRLVLEQVIDELYLDYKIEDLAKEIAVTSLDDTEILKISVTDKNPYTAMLIANTLSKIFETEVSKIYNLDNISIIDDAKVPLEVSNDTLTRDMIIVLFVSLFGGIAIVFIKYYFDDTLRDTETLEKDMNLPILSRVYKDQSGKELLVKEQPNAIASESIRTLRANLQFSSVDKKMQTLLITSTMPGEGKSFISCNLATSFAQAGKKVLLIDCDLRKGRQHEIFGLYGKKGLSNLLVEDINNYELYINETGVNNLSLIPRGAFPPNPNELLSSKKMINLLNILKEKYDLIVLDGAPCGGLSDSLALSSVADRVLIVCSLNYAQKKGLNETKKDLEKFGAKIAGFAVNNVRMKKAGYGYYSYHKYGSYGSYSGYGYSSSEAEGN